MVFLNKKIFGFNDSFFALDISDLSIKIIQLEKKGNSFKVRSFSSVGFKHGYLEDGRIKDKVKIAELIKVAINKSIPKKINTTKVVCSLPESKAFLRIISIPLMEEKELAEALKWEMEASIPLTFDQVYFDWQVINRTKDKQDILTVAMAKDIVDEFMDVFSLAGLAVYGLETESIANIRSLIPRDVSSEETSLIIDLGARNTSFMIVEGTVPCFTSSIAFSSEGITDVIAKALNIDPQEAEKIKNLHGIEHSFERNSVFDAVRSSLENIAIEIERSSDFYKSLKKNAEIKKIILCGGGSNLKGLIAYLTTRLNREVTVADPWINLNLGNTIPPINKEDAARYATAIGLALKDINIDYGNKT